MSTHTKVVVLSGGMGDIGMAIAKKLSMDGFTIFLLYHTTLETKVDLFLKTLSGNDHIALPCDLTNTKEVNKTIQNGYEKLGRIDICIHSAVSPLVRKNVSNITLQEFREQFEVTTFGGLNLFKAIIPIMKKIGGGRIIAITSSILKPNSPMSSMIGYLSAKSALVGILKDLYKEVKIDRITVNAIAPEFVATSLHKDLPDKIISFLKERIPSNTPDEVADTISFLCGEETKNVTGMSYTVKKLEVTPL